VRGEGDAGADEEVAGAGNGQVQRLLQLQGGRGVNLARGEGVRA